MAFGQQSGPPASAKQVKDLLGLLQGAGHDDFRDARGPMGFTQRQAAGKFTRAEADAFIEQLEGSGDAGGEALSETADGPTEAPGPLHDVPTPVLAAELQRRGWIVVEP